MLWVVAFHPPQQFLSLFSHKHFPRASCGQLPCFGKKYHCQTLLYDTETYSQGQVQECIRGIAAMQSHLCWVSRMWTARFLSYISDLLQTAESLPLKCNDAQDMVVTNRSFFWSQRPKVRLKWMLPMQQNDFLILFFSCIVRSILDSSDRWPCPTLHSLWDETGIDFGFQNIQMELTRCCSQRRCEE